MSRHSKQASHVALVVGSLSHNAGLHILIGFLAGRNDRMTHTLHLYRGIAVQEAAADLVVEAIRQNGLVIEGRFWSGLAVPDLKPRLKDLWRLPSVSLG